VSKIKKLLSYGSALATVAVINPSAVLGQAALPPPAADTASVANVDVAYDPLKTYTPSQFLRTVLNVMLGIAGVVSFIFLLWGGLQWILAGGDKEGTEKARKKITAALIGLAIVFSAYALLYILRVLFNIDLIQVNLTQIGT
jgi:TRAP-type C4-dicarboxylate transport system permease small subunit